MIVGGLANFYSSNSPRRLYERLAECERAADAYDRYLLETANEESDEQEDRGRANMYLAEFMLSHNLFDQAEEYAKRCIGCAEVGVVSITWLGGAC